MKYMCVKKKLLLLRAIEEHTLGFIVEAKNLLLSGQLFAALISHPLPSNHTLMDARNNNGYLEQLILISRPRHAGS